MGTMRVTQPRGQVLGQPLRTGQLRRSALASPSRPALLGSFTDCLPTGGTQLSFRLRLRWGGTLCSDFGPPCLLSGRDPLPGRGAHLPPGVCWFSSGGFRCAVGLQQLTEFVNLRVDAPFLRFEAFDRGVNDFSCELFRHLNLVRRDHSSTRV